MTWWLRKWTVLQKMWNDEQVWCYFQLSTQLLVPSILFLVKPRNRTSSIDFRWLHGVVRGGASVCPDRSIFKSKTSISIGAVQFRWHGLRLKISLPWLRKTLHLNFITSYLISALNVQCGKGFPTSQTNLSTSERTHSSLNRQRSWRQSSYADVSPG